MDETSANLSVHTDGQESRANSYDDSIVRQFATATLIWGLVATLIGLVVAVLMVAPTMFQGREALSFGRLRPVHTNTAIFAFVGNAMFAAIYYSTQRLCRSRMYSDLLSRLHFWGWQAIIVASAITIPIGMTQGKEYAEPEWPIDLAIALVWIGFFGGNFVMTLIRRRQRHLYISLWFYIATFVVVSVLHVMNNLVFPVDLGKSIPIYAGVQDAMVQWWYGHNLTMFFMTIPFLGMMYYFVPKASGHPVFSYKLAIIHFWSLVLISMWLGPHHLHYTALPEWASSLGMVFALMLWMPSWGGMLNGLLTLRGASKSDSVDSPESGHRDPSIKFFIAGLLFYGWATLEGPLLGIKSVNSVTHYSDWTIAHVHVAALGWNSMMIFGMIYWLLPRIFQTAIWSRRAITIHFWLALASVFLYVLPIYLAAMRQTSVWLDIDPQTGNLAHFDFIDSVRASHSMWEHRIHGGLAFVIGLGLMGINYAMTWTSRPKTYSSPVIQIPQQTNGITIDEPVAPSELETAPVLNAAKRLDVLSRLDWHAQWERSAGRFVWVPLIALAIAAVCEVIPVLAIRSAVAKTGTINPYTPLELAGRDIYVAEGCFNCHSQMIRPIVAETKRYGQYSLPHEFDYDRPFQWGSRRIGPDLQREGGLRPSLWHWQHLENPRNPEAGDERSVMPSFAHLHQRKIDFDKIPERVQAAKTFGAPYEFDASESADIARRQAESVAAEIVSMGGPIRRGNVLTLESQAVALIAYLQRLGTDRDPAPANDQVAATELNIADVDTTEAETE